MLSEAELTACKHQAGERAASLVPSNIVVGLGTGSTAEFAIEAIARRLSQGDLMGIVGIPTSSRTLDLARASGIPLSTLNEHPVLDMTIDGADEIDPAGDLIKGGGGALLWEKIIAKASTRYVIVADETKLVDRLGVACSLPVEVVAFGWKTHLNPIRQLGAEATLRVDDRGHPYRTDEGHYILDCRFGDGIPDATTTDQAIRSRPGVVETGLFLGLSPEIIIGSRHA